MRRCALGLTVASACMSALVQTGCRTSQSPNAAAAHNSKPVAMLHAPGTIVSIEERAHDEQSDDLLPGPRVCFKIDSFDAIPRDVRSTYESAEQARQAKRGPRCHDTAVDPSAIHFKIGDQVEIQFTLESGGQISVVGVSTQGVDL